MDPVLFSNTPEGRTAFETLAHQIVDWIVTYYDRIESMPVRSAVSPGDIYGQFEDKLPKEPVSNEIVFRALNEVILPGMTHWQHPNFYAFFPGNASFPSIAAEMITAGMAAQCMLWETSPAAAELEQRCMAWCRDLLGLPSGWEGAIQDTASSATLTALLTAREWKSGFRISKRGFDGTIYRIYASGQAHSSIEKAVRLAGYGTDNLVYIPTDHQLALQPDKLEEAIRADIQRGFMPTCIVSTIGSTGSGAIDPIPAISRIAIQYGLWHHIDAAYMGTALMLEELAHLRNGLDGADSFVFNAHKWMFVQFDCTMYYVRDPELLVRTMSINPSYLMTSQGDKVNDYRDWGIPLGRRFRALKLWMTLHLLGTDAIKARLRHHIQLAMEVESWIQSSPMLDIVYPRSLNVLTFRIKKHFDPFGLATKQLATRINDSGKAYMTFAVVQEVSLIRWVIGQTHVELHHVQDTWSVLLDKLAQLNLNS